TKANGDGVPVKVLGVPSTAAGTGNHKNSPARAIGRGERLEGGGTRGGGAGPVKVLGLPGRAGGTVITVPVPAGIMDGDVLVKALGTGGASLSNAWPMDVGAPAGDPPVAVSINPTSG